MTSSKAPALVGLYGRKEFAEVWDCILNKRQEKPKHFSNFQWAMCTSVLSDPASLDFNALLGMRQTANSLARTCPEIGFRANSGHA